MVIVCALMFVGLVVSANGCSVAAIRREYNYFDSCGVGMVLNPENRYKEVSALSALHCGLQCASDVACQSFDYDPDLAVCYLGSVAVGLNCTQHMRLQSGSGVQHYAQGSLCKGGRGRLAGGTCQCPPAFNGPHCLDRMQDCTDWYNYTECDGEQWIWPYTSQVPFRVHCDQMTQKARTVLMRRRLGDVEFLRGWEDYSAGFGQLAQDHWLGLRHMHLLTSNRRYQLKFSLKLGNVSDTVIYVVHSHVHIGNESSGYRLTTTPMKASASTSTNVTLLDCFYPDLLHTPFSASGVDNDQDDSKTCWQLLGGGWWFNGTANCSLCNPTGRLVLSGDGQRSGASDELYWATGASGEGLVPHSLLMFLLPE